jgi:hypothetical protein
VAEAEREVAMPSPNVQAEAPASGGALPPQGPMPTMIDLSFDDPPSDKGEAEGERRDGRRLGLAQDLCGAKQ